MKCIHLIVSAALLVLFILASTACGGTAEIKTKANSSTGAADENPSITAGEAIPANIDAVPAFPELRFDSPVYITWVPGGQDRLAVLEQQGVIRVFSDTDSASETETFLDIRDKVHAGGEEGLLGLAFDPGFKDNGRFYVYYSASSPRRSVLSRLTIKSDGSGLADPASEEILLEVDQPYANHNGGNIAFGPDGYLYVALGDGGDSGDPGGNAQNRATLLGSILRVDVDKANPAAGRPYTIPFDNPFAASGENSRGEIWAYGFRNPYRFSFDRMTGDLWAGDVGERSREEVDLVKPGGNYGWNIYEGTLEYKNPQQLPLSDFEAPVVDYGRSQGQTVIGGYVYRGNEYPALGGIYFYGDYGSGYIRALVYRDGSLIADKQVAHVNSISSFGEDQAGELFVVSLNGEIYRLQLS